LDRALLVPFEIITVLKGVRRKKGRRPTIDGFSSIASRYDENGPAIYINRETYSVTTPSGRRLKGTTKSDPISEFRLTHLPGGVGNIQFNQELRFGLEAVRGLFKIAVESVAFFEGLEAARNPELDLVKAFVTKGSGNFRALLMPDPNPGYESYFGPCFRAEDGSRAVGMTILGIGFICDFESDFRTGRLVLAEMSRQGLSGQVIPNWPKSLWLANNPLPAT
jgi:hypothetical protein